MWGTQVGIADSKFTVKSKKASMSCFFPKFTYRDSRAAIRPILYF